MSMNAPDGPEERIRLTPEQVRKRRARNIAIGLALAMFAGLFYAITVVKLGPGVLGKGM
jgi:hypothetical protein